MSLTVLAACIVVICAAVVIWIKYSKSRARRQLEQHSITPDALHAMMASHRQVLVFDVRQPLDLLADSEIIPGAKRIPPRDVLEDPSMIPQDMDAVIYCTCPADETSRRVLQRALARHFLRIKLLKGGLAAWKAKGYPVEPYTTPFHLDVRT
jgi:rhodanese-related sulfurtransferase